METIKGRRWEVTFIMLMVIIFGVSLCSSLHDQARETQERRKKCLENYRVIQYEFVSGTLYCLTSNGWIEPKK